MIDEARAGDWSLPFAERYHRIKRDRDEMPPLIAYHRGEIEAHQHALAEAERRLALAEATFDDMLEHDHDQLVSLELHRDQVSVALRAAGWKL